MDTITTYLDHSFRELPRTTEVLRARAELEQMCLDRYNELLDSGLSENEAVGRVIAQFGNIDEMADDLGIRKELDQSRDSGGVFLTKPEAERYLNAVRRQSWLVSLGVALILLGAAAYLALSDSFEGSNGELSLTGGIVMSGFLLLIAIAVGVFIFANVTTEKFERYDEEGIELDPASRLEYSALREREAGPFAIKLGAGVAIVLLGVIAMLIATAVLREDHGYVSSFVLVGAAIAAPIFITAGMRRSALSRLAAEGEFEPAKRAQNSLVDRIAGIYWLSIVLIYLGWSFGFKAWQSSWIIWPIAGIGFGLLVAILGLRQKK